MSDLSIIRRGGGGTKLFAAISVIYPEGSTLTCANGSQTFKAKTTSGKWVFAVPKAGTWTVTSTNGTSTASAAVEITYEGQSENVTLGYEKYVYDNGTINTADFGGLTAYAYIPSTSSATTEKPTVAVNTASIKLSFADAEYTRGGSYFANNPINLSNYNNIHIKVSSAKTNNSKGYIRFGSTLTKANKYEVSSAQTICNGTTTVSNQTFDLSVADLAGDHYLFINLYGGGLKNIEFTEWWLD